MFRVYDENELLFNHNGIKILKPLKAIIYKEDNGKYYCDFEDTIDNLEFYQKGLIIQVPTPWGYQGFRCDNPEIKNNRIVTRAKHLYFDSANYIIKDSYISNKNCNDALDHICLATDIPVPFTTISDVNTINSYRCVRRSLEEAISIIIDRWGGHLVRDNYNIEIRANMGEDRGVNLSYSKNITSSEVKENWDNVVTKILPVGKDGLLLDETYLEIEEQLYNVPHTKVVSFNQDLEQLDNQSDEDYMLSLKADLRNKALNYLEDNKLPKVSYKIGAWLQDVADVGDTIYVKHPKINIDLITNVTAVKYDAINKKYKSIEFGNYQNRLNTLVSNVTEKAREEVNNVVNENNTIIHDELTKATSKIWDNLGSSYVIKEDDRILVLDNLPKEEAKNIIVINKNGIGFGENGINGNVNSAWTIDGTLDMQRINVINLVADMIKGGTLKLGSQLNESGIIELYDEANTLIVTGDKEGLTIYQKDGGYVKLNPTVGFAGYDKLGNKTYWADGSEFHMRKAFVEEEITFAYKVRFLGISNATNEGIGIVPLDS